MGADVSDWSEIQTDHFRLRAQLDEASALDAAHGLEAVRAAMLAYWPEAAPRDRLEVLVYRDVTSLADFGAAPGFIAQTANGPMIVTSIVGLHAPEFQKVIAHHLAHQLAAWQLPRAPRWLSEGLAEYLESYEVNGASVTFGKPPGTVGPADLSGQPVTLAQLWDWTTQDDLPAQRAAWAWWFVAYLQNTYAESFELWQRAIARGEEPKGAWTRSFSGTTDELIEAEVLAALQKRQLKFQKVTFAFKPGHAEPVRIDAASLHSTRAELLLQSSPLDFEYRRAAATAELEAALAIDAKNVDALVLKARLMPEDSARAFVQQLTQTLPQSAKAWGLMASIVGRDGDDPRETLQFALALSPDHPGLLNTLAWYSTLYEDKTEGMRLAEKAAALRPWSAAMVDTSAATMGAAGRCAEAAARQRNALDLLVHASAEQRADYVTRLRAYETQCSRSRPTALRR